MNTSLRLLVTLALSSASAAFAAEPGISATEIKLGMANALTGNSAALGTGMSTGAKAYFAQLNASGGIHGRNLNLVSLDDGYEPDRCVAQTKVLLEKEQVFSLLGYVGTPTATAIMPTLAQNSDVVFFAPFTGAEFLRNPVKKNVFNVRASYFDETEGLVERLTSDLGVKSVSVFVQDDAFGSAGEAGVQKALFKRGLKLAGKGTYKRNTTDVAAGVAALKAAAPQTVIMVGTYKACAAFIKQCRAEGFNPIFCNISFVGTAALAAELGAGGDGVYISQVMPSPWDASIPVVAKYQAAMKAAGQPDFDYTSLEGYVAASVFSEALRKVGPAPTRATLLTTLEALDVDVGGVRAAFSAGNHQASHQVYFTVLRDGRAVPVTRFTSAR